jgi:hypothetical protein
MNLVLKIPGVSYSFVLFKAKAELADMKKEVESLRTEKEVLLKKLDTLEAANERFVDMKVSLWSH